MIVLIALLWFSSFFSGSVGVGEGRGEARGESRFSAKSRGETNSRGERCKPTPLPSAGYIEILAAVVY